MTVNFSCEDTFFACFVKFNEFKNFRNLRKFFFNLLNCIGRREFAAREKFVHIADNANGFIRETCTFKSDEVDHFDTAVTAFGSHKRRDVFGHGTDTGNHHCPLAGNPGAGNGG